MADKDDWRLNGRKKRMERSSLDEMIRRTLHPSLMEKGFTHKARTWNRNVGWYIDVVDVQVGRWSRADEGDFTVNVGVFVPSVYKVFWGEDAPPFVAEERCVVRARLGALKNDGGLAEDNLKARPTDLWWDFDASTDLEALGREVSELVVDLGLPFLEGLHSIEAVHRFLMTPHAERQVSVPYAYCYLAIIKAQMGDDIGAKRLLEHVGQRWHSWQAVTSRVADQLEV